MILCQTLFLNYRWRFMLCSISTSILENFLFFFYVIYLCRFCETSCPTKCISCTRNIFGFKFGYYCAQEIEKKAFETANSRFEYFHSIVEKHHAYPVCYYSSIIVPPIVAVPMIGPMKKWHIEISNDIRNHQVHKM